MKLKKNTSVAPVYLDNKNIRLNNKYIDQYFRESQKNVEKYYKYFKNQIDFIDCPICKSKRKILQYKLQSFFYDKCLNCKSVYVSNPLKQEVLLEKYQKAKGDLIYIKMMKIGYLKKYNELLYKKYFKIIKKLGITKGNLIDIGCGSGEFLKYTKKKHPKFNLYATEHIGYAKKFIEKIIAKKRFFFQKNISDLKKNNFFNIITLWGVLEHVRKPVAFLSYCKKMLKEKGIILILIPNYYSEAKNILGVNTPTLNPIIHLNFFSIKGMSMIAKKLRLKLYGPFLELPIIDLMYPYLRSIKESKKNIIKEKKTYYHVYLLRK